MDLEWYLALFLFGILHWVLAVMLLHDLATRKQVLGGAKGTVGSSDSVGCLRWFAGLPVLSPPNFL